MIKRLSALVGMIAVCMIANAASLGCSSDDSSSSCVNKSECINGLCKCTDGANKDKSCCDSSDSACANDPTKCDVYCKSCS
jgi:hypothetical protein